MIQSTNVSNIAAALVAAQKNMTVALKDSKNPFFKSKYADINSVIDAAMPALLDQGITVLQPTVTEGNKNYVRTMLLHTSGEFITSDTEIVCSKQNDPQALGSAITYARRYGLQSFVTLKAGDDDAETAMSRDNATENKAPASKSSFRKEGPNNGSTTGSGWS